ncbi:MAG TPA: carboxypeptidase-like regulatory domain-containing protein, partial [Candidatus Eisenbacteria bacterium]|nr:carboxypeptidase-like regulatory domain-containing protein [Candidatus Eisenbacteria bacterium]
MSTATVLSELVIAAQLLQATLVGTVRDEETATPLSGAVVLLPELDRAAGTDDEGRYTLRHVPPGPHHILVRSLGYAPRTLHAIVPPDGQLTIDVTLRPEPVRLHSIEVTAPVPVRGLDSLETMT